MRAKKLQIVVDPVIEYCLRGIEGNTKVDKIRWALCVYQVAQTMEKQRSRSYADPLTFLMTEAGRIYRATKSKGK